MTRYNDQDMELLINNLLALHDDIAGTNKDMSGIVKLTQRKFRKQASFNKLCLAYMIVSGFYIMKLVNKVERLKNNTDEE